jgi:NodT family efflux transporter outer membrane factor (OMF) lipoprotein
MPRSTGVKVAIAGVALLLAGCLRVGPDYIPPPLETPDRWHRDLTRGLQSGDADLKTWWTLLGDPELIRLIERSAEGNLDLRAAVARVQEARAARGFATGQRFPDVDATGTIQKDRISGGVTDSFPPPPRDQGRHNTFYSFGGDAFWELDLWGRIARSIEASDAGLQASIEDYRDVLVSLYAEVAATYVEVRALQERITYAESNVKTQSGSLQLTTDRRDAGIGSDLDVSQAEQNLARTEAFIPSLRIQLARSIHALGVLLGKHPGALYAELAPVAPIPGPADSVAVGVPVDVVRRRPDVRRAERFLAAQTAQIGVVTADLYPTFSFGGVFAIEAFDPPFDAGNQAYNFGPSFRWNLFDGGRVRSQIRVEDAQTEEALANYEQTVLFALREVEDSMVAFVQEQERRDSLSRAASASRRAVDLVSTLYRTGLTDFQNVLDSQRTLFEQEDQLAQSEGLVTQNLISLYRALGGGWSPDTPAP